jgi:hypothetical protein
MSEKLAIIQNNEEIRKILKLKGREHVDHPAVIVLIRALQDVPADTNYELMMYIIEHFDQLYELLQHTRKKLKEVFECIGFELGMMSNATIVLDELGYCKRTDYAMVCCKFVLINKKTYEMLKLMTTFRVGKTVNYGTDNYYTEWWHTDKLELMYDDNDKYTLNRAIVRQKGFCREIMDALSKVSYLFKICEY